MTTTLQTDRTDTLVDRLFEATIGGLELFSIHLGRRLGLYACLADGSSRTATELAAEAGIAPRYAREWLEQQAVAGFLDVEAGAGDRRYLLARDQADVLAHPEHPAHVAPFGSMLAGIGGALPAVVDAYRSGGGVPYVDYGDDFRDGQGAINRPAFTHDLVTTWLPAVADVDQRLRAGARVADIGCGQGWSSIAVARAYPHATVVGIDADAASVEDAHREIPQDLRGRIEVVRATASTAVDHGPFDVVLVLEALHDFADPTAALAGIREALAPGGVVIVADERVADAFGAPGDEVERMMYGWSVVHCLPASMAEGKGGEAVGTVIRADTVRRLATAAGFARTEVLGIENDLFRFYRLDG